MKWDPDLNINGIGPLVRDPNNPCKITRRRHAVLLGMLLECGTISAILEVRRIMSAYPYLREEWEPKTDEAARKLSEDDDDVPRPRSRSRIARVTL
jgi:hypothetical protein